MKPNIGTIDQIIRIGIALTITVLYFTNIISGPVAIVLMVLGIALQTTSLVGFCPVYLPLRISTRGNQN